VIDGHAVSMTRIGMTLKQAKATKKLRPGTFTGPCTYTGFKKYPTPQGVMTLGARSRPSNRRLCLLKESLDEARVRSLNPSGRRSL
jgi:hypothetical protein